jgi:hypothetical protein
MTYMSAVWMLSAGPSRLTISGADSAPARNRVQFGARHVGLPRQRGHHVFDRCSESRPAMRQQPPQANAERRPFDHGATVAGTAFSCSEPFGDRVTSEK